LHPMDVGGLLAATAALPAMPPAARQVFVRRLIDLTAPSPGQKMAMVQALLERCVQGGAGESRPFAELAACFNALQDAGSDIGPLLIQADALVRQSLFFSVAPNEADLHALLRLLANHPGPAAAVSKALRDALKSPSVLQCRSALRAVNALLATPSTVDVALAETSFGVALQVLFFSEPQHVRRLADEAVAIIARNAPATDTEVRTLRSGMRERLERRAQSPGQWATDFAARVLRERGAAQTNTDWRASVTEQTVRLGESARGHVEEVVTADTLRAMAAALMPPDHCARVFRLPAPAP